MFTALSLASLLAILPIVRSVPTWDYAQASFSPEFQYGNIPVRGVNLGGWLVLEVCYCPSSHLETRPQFLPLHSRSRG
jgi:hypothetical protein